MIRNIKQILKPGKFFRRVMLLAFSHKVEEMRTRWGCKGCRKHRTQVQSNHTDCTLESKTVKRYNKLKMSC